MSVRAAWSALFVVSVGTLLHFVFEWSDESPVVAVVAATNESPWEHLKMAFWPALGLAPVQRHLYGRPPGWLLATVIRTLLPPALILAVFYGYTSILGTHQLVLDAATFVLAVVAGEFAGHSVMSRTLARGTRVVALVLLAVAVAAFAMFTFQPPAWFLFRES